MFANFCPMIFPRFSHHHLWHRRYKRFINREVTVFGTEEDENETKVLQAFSLGLWAFMDPNNYGLCFTYPSNMQFDSYFKASRAMAPISSIFGGIVMVTFWFTSCMGMDKSCWRFYGFLLMVRRRISFLLHLTTSICTSFMYNAPMPFPCTRSLLI